MIFGEKLLFPSKASACNNSVSFFWHTSFLLAMNFDADECLVTAMFDKGNRNDTMEAIDNIIPFLKGDADMIGLVCNTIRKLFCMSDEGYEIFLMDLEDYKTELEEEDEE